ncbi:MAG: methyltransferase [Oscillospiraceae bacterium]|nr:methyltransferase [Oscillospiraceae bacterium]
MEAGTDRLWPGGPEYRQFEGVFPLSSDTGWLGAFVRLNGVKTVCDLGCGGGALSLQLLGRRPALSVSALDVLPEAVAAAEFNAALNGFSLRAVCADLRDWRRHFRPGSFDLAVSNPPYWPRSGGVASGSRGVARQESCSPSELCAAAAGLVRPRGKFCLVYPPERLGELICAMTEAGLEPKRLRLVHKDASSPPCAALLEGVLGGGKGLEILPPLFTEEEKTL